MSHQIGEIFTDENGNKYTINEYGLYTYIGIDKFKPHEYTEHDGRTYWIDSDGKEHDILTDPEVFGYDPTDEDPPVKDVNEEKTNDEDEYYNIPLLFREANIDKISGFPLLPNRPKNNSENAIMTYLTYLHNNYPHIVFTDSQILFDLSGDYNDICYPVWDFYQNKPNYQLNAEDKKYKGDKFIRGRLAAKKITPDIVPQEHDKNERRSKDLYIYENDITNLTKEEIEKLPEYEYMASYYYAYFVMGHVWYDNDLIDDQKNPSLIKYPLSTISEAQFIKLNHTILNMPVLSLYQAFEYAEDRLNTMGYKISANQGASIIPKLWAFLDAGHYFTNYNCSKSISRAEVGHQEILYPILDFLHEGSTEPVKGWIRYVDKKYYPLNYKKKRLVVYVNDLKADLYNLESDYFIWNFYDVETQEAQYMAAYSSTHGAQGVIRDPITKPADAELISTGYTLSDLRNVNNNPPSPPFDPWIKWEMLAVITGSGLAAILTYYFSESVTFAVYVGGTALFIGTAAVLLGNIENIISTIEGKIINLFVSS